MTKASQNIKFCVLLICSYFFALNPITAECSIDSGSRTGFFNAKSGSTIVTQIFTACETGPFNSFSFDLKSSGYQAEKVTVAIQDYPSGNKLATALGTLDIVPVAAGAEETFTFIPTTNFEVQAGQVYKIIMSLNIVFNREFSGVAAGRGGGFEFSQTTPTDTSIGLATVDNAVDFRSGAGSGRMMNALAFRLVLGNPTDSMASIPTMSQWGLMIFGLGILNICIWLIYRKEGDFR